VKAAHTIGPRTIEVRDIPIPIAAPDGLVLQISVCGVCGSDVRRWREGPGATALPVVAGHEAVGRIVAVGAQVTGYAIGERLAIAPDTHCGTCYYCERGLYNLCDNLHLVGITPGWQGGFAEYLPLSGEVLRNGIVHRVPAALSDVAAALSEPCASVLASHNTLGTTLGDTVVVIGAGPIGCIHIAVAQARGARVIVAQRSEPRRLLARRFGPDLVIDASTQDVISEVLAFTEGRGADAIICANGVAETQAQAVMMARKGGAVVLFGGLPKANPMVTLDANRIHYGEISVLGAFSYHPTIHALALDTLARGLVPAEHLVTHLFALDDINEAFEVASTGRGLKVMVAPDPAILDWPLA